MDVGRTMLRGILGPLMIGHGTQKLFGWFGGRGLDGTSSFFERNLGLRPGRRNAMAAGGAETLCGVLLTLGAFTPLASTLLSSTMITAIRKVNLKHGLWVPGDGYEYNLVQIAATAALAGTGPGRPSVDRGARTGGVTGARRA